MKEPTGMESLLSSSDAEIATLRRERRRLYFKLACEIAAVAGLAAALWWAVR